jgi:hypothetical protein
VAPLIRRSAEIQKAKEMMLSAFADIVKDAQI